LGVGYNGNFQNRISFYDTAFSARRLLDTLQWGAEHSIPISLSLPAIVLLQLLHPFLFNNVGLGKK
jgi:hypothetical protein